MRVLDLFSGFTRPFWPSDIGRCDIQSHLRRAIPLQVLQAGDVIFGAQMQCRPISSLVDYPASAHSNDARVRPVSIDVQFSLRQPGRVRMSRDALYGVAACRGVDSPICQSKIRHANLGGLTHSAGSASTWASPIYRANIEAFGSSIQSILRSSVGFLLQLSALQSLDVNYLKPSLYGPFR